MTTTTELPLKTHGIPPLTDMDDEDLIEAFDSVRRQTVELCAPLATEDFVVQSMPDVSPTRWHLAHTTWFFETFVLKPFAHDYEPIDSRYAYLFNSYYNAVGPQFPRPRRGVLSRPTVDDVMAYRRHVDAYVPGTFDRLSGDDRKEARDMVRVGLSHEQQHQELILTDIKHVFASNPLRPVYRDAPQPVDRAAPSLEWAAYPAGLAAIGFEGDGFAYDNERPRHQVYVEAFRVASRLATSGEYLRFIEDGAYERPELWLSDGWNAVVANGWTAPLYWERQTGAWRVMTLSGMRDLDPAEPVSHVSFFEADAYARWLGQRLPTEAEWERAAADVPVEGRFLEDGLYHPRSPELRETSRPAQMFGDLWEWTASPYTPYPGFRPAAGALGEYNGKFMCNQMVLRGGSCATPQSHIRPTYRNFFPPDARWQFTGIRLACDA